MEIEGVNGIADFRTGSLFCNARMYLRIKRFVFYRLGFRWIAQQEFKAEIFKSSIASIWRFTNSQSIRCISSLLFFYDYIDWIRITLFRSSVFKSDESFAIFQSRAINSNDMACEKLLKCVCVSYKIYKYLNFNLEDANRSRASRIHTKIGRQLTDSRNKILNLGKRGGKNSLNEQTCLIYLPSDRC